MSKSRPVAPGQDRKDEANGDAAPAPAPGTDRLQLHKDLGGGVLAIAGLSSLAFAQPVYDLLRRAPEFFAIRNLYMGDLLALVVLVAVAPTLALASPLVAARFLRPSWLRAAAATTVGLLVALIALQAVRDLPGPAALTIALPVWAGAAWSYLRSRGARTFALLLSGAAVLVPVFLLLDGDVRRSAERTVGSVDVPQTDTGARTPIVMVVFDEWSLTSILGRNGEIDRERLPNLAALADQATWYPNATAAADTTELALPAMLAGSPAKQGRLPTASEYPVNLFSLLAPSHELYALEPVSSLCPADVNLLAAPRPAFQQRLGLLVSDLSLVWLNLSLPAAWTSELPSVTQTWSGFGQDGPPTVAPPTGQPVQRALFHLRTTDRAAEFRSFIDAIGPTRGRPAFYFMHSLLPHVPWEYLPSGRRYHAPRGRMHGLERELWTTDTWPVRHHQKRYLLQVEFVDRLIGELIDRLESVGLFDESLVVVTADHGVAFRPGLSRRLLEPDEPSREQLLDVAAVPLLVKVPFQDEAATDDRLLSLAELTPVILELAGADERTSPPGKHGPGGPLVVGKYAGAIGVPPDRESWRRSRLVEQTELLGDSNDPSAIGERPELHGRRITDFPTAPGEAGIQLVAALQWDYVEPDRPVLPALAEGVLESREPLSDRTVAVALNGTLAATLKPHRTADGKSRIAAALPESLFRPGLNQLDVFFVSGSDQPVELEHVPRPPFSVYDLSWNDSGRVDGIVRRPRSALGLDSETVPLEPQKPDGLIGFLDHGYEMRDGIQGWAIDVDDPGSIGDIVAFLGGRQFGVAATSLERPDVAERFGTEHLHSGFVLSETSQALPERRGHSRDEIATLVRREGLVAYAVSRRAVATRLRFSYRPIERPSGGGETLPITDGRQLPVQPPGSGLAGAIDLVTREGQRTAIEGWAADLERRERPRQIVIYRDGEFLVSLGANRQRPDIAAAHDDERLLRTGFRGTVPGAPDPATFSERHRVFAVMLRGAAVELPVRPPEGPAVQQ